MLRGMLLPNPLTLEQGDHSTAVLRLIKLIIKDRQPINPEVIINKSSYPLWFYRPIYLS